MKVEVEQNYYTETLLKNNPNKIYIFGDNLLRYGTGGQATIRFEENSRGIVTKKEPKNNPGSFFTDDDYDEFEYHVKRDIKHILNESDKYTIVFPKDGIGTGLANLKNGAPKCYTFLKEILLEKFGFDNDTGELI